MTVQRRLLDPQEGTWSTVRFDPLPRVPLDEWVALDSVIDGHRLTYRLR